MMGDDYVFERAKQKAFRLLLARSRSEHELRLKLKERGFEGSVINAVVDRLLELKYLDDEAFARGWVRNLAVNRLWGNKKIAISLREKGITGAPVQQAIAEAREELGERDAVTIIIEKKYGKKKSPEINWSAISAKEKRRIIQNLMGRGFPPGLIYDVLDKPKEECADDRE